MAEFTSAVRQMTRLMHKRGPDSNGFWIDPDKHLQLGFQRLAVLDLTPAGNQPMHSKDGRSVLVFNGEIYNYRELRLELDAYGARFRSRSDSEVLLEALNYWGVDAIPRLNGMFAFAWYDLQERRLLLARDHAGIKPLYYYVHPNGEGLAFASQYNCLLHTPWGTPGDVRLNVLHLYLRLHHIPPPYGLLENTYQLEPGHYLVVHPDGRLEDHAWWRLPRDPQPDSSTSESLDVVQNSLEGAVRRQRIADVPLGVFLSGGVDSPLVTAIARQQTGPDLKAFTIGSPGWWQDESLEAARYGEHLGVDHYLHPTTAKEAIQAIPAVMAAQHEPFGDFSILPTLLVCQFARRELTVALSGDGGDELFFGYERPLSLLRNGGDFRWPRAVRLALYAAGKYGIGPNRSDVIVHPSPGDYYYEVNSRLRGFDLARIAPGLPPLPADFSLYRFNGYQGRRHLANFSRYVEFYGQLQRSLKKVDMASMYHSLEVRVPLLDRDVIRASLRIDPFTHMKNGSRKALLRDLLGRYVPQEIIPTPKRGFAVPLGEWMRGPMRELVEDTLLSHNLYPEGVFVAKEVDKYWREHLTGEKDHKWGLWTILALQWWAQSHLRMTSSY